MIYEKLYQEAKANPVDFFEYEPTLTEDIRYSAVSVLTGAYTGLLAKPSTALGSVMVYLSERIDGMLGLEDDSGTTEYLKNSLAATVKHIHIMQETAQSRGRLTATLFSMSDILGSFAGAGKFTKGVGGAASLAGGVQGYADYEQGLAEGLDKSTAAEKAVITGGSVALGGYIPLSMGFRFSPATKAWVESQSRFGKVYAYGNLGLHDVMHTAGANVAIGVGQRGFTHDLLKAHGYNQMADQYQALDQEALLIDAGLGMIFGGAAKYAELRQQRFIDALLAKNNQRHQNDAAMGIPTDVESLNMHDRALNKAFDDMINDRPVNVDAIVKEGHFILKEDVDWHNVVSDAIAKRFPDDAMYYSKNGTPIPARLVDEIKQELINKRHLTKQDKRDIVSLNNGIVPPHLTHKVSSKIDIKASELEETFNIYQRAETMSDVEFNALKHNKAFVEGKTSTDAIEQILKDKPDMQINHIDENGIESFVNVKDLLETANNEVAKAHADKKLYDAAVACMLRNS